MFIKNGLSLENIPNYLLYSFEMKKKGWTQSRVNNSNVFKKALFFKTVFDDITLNEIFRYDRPDLFNQKPIGTFFGKQIKIKINADNLKIRFYLKSEIWWK